MGDEPKPDPQPPTSDLPAGDKEAEKAAKIAAAKAKAEAAKAARAAAEKPVDGAGPAEPGVSDGPKPDPQPSASDPSAGDKDAEKAAKIAAAKAKAEAAKAARAATEKAESGAGSGTPEKAAEVEKPKPKPAPKKDTAAAIIPITGDVLIDRLKEKFSDVIKEAVLINQQQVVRVARAGVRAILHFLKNEATPDFDFITDLTAVHYPDRGFEVIYQLYAVDEARRLRVKTDLADGESVPTVTDLWGSANWLEREVYDMYGISFEGHPDLRRILLPDGWVGHPLRKEYKLEYEDNQWVTDHLNILEIPHGADLTGKFE
ncbi:MAG: NADH-quinone oxidoreductase subunit C [Blastocatellia bacterium]|nr:NADH-quinone oxidoreductase subunit C [Blastocatellia bacterium]